VLSENDTAHNNNVSDGIRVALRLTVIGIPGKGCQFARATDDRLKSKQWNSGAMVVRL